MDSSEHAIDRELLTLAAAGALDPGEQRRVEQHLLSCAECRAEFQTWSRFTEALESLPTPSAPEGLVERTRGLLEARAQVAAERRHNRSLLVWVIVLGWATTLLTWPLFRLFGGDVAGFLGISSGSVTQAWIAYIVISWMITVVAAGLLGQRRLRQERTV